jgi:hypothetical protein
MAFRLFHADVQSGEHDTEIDPAFGRHRHPMCAASAVGM